MLCLPGLSRNSRDFQELAMRHAPERRVICPDYRGRGRSDYDQDPKNYHPKKLLDDIRHLLVAANLHHFVVIGTSMGGILAIALSALIPSAVRGIVLNDIGPDIGGAGFGRILPVSRQRQSAIRLGDGDRRSQGNATGPLVPNRRRVASRDRRYVSRGRGRRPAYRLGSAYRRANENTRRQRRIMDFVSGDPRETGPRLSRRELGYSIRGDDVKNDGTAYAPYRCHSRRCGAHAVASGRRGDFRNRHFLERNLANRQPSYPCHLYCPTWRSRPSCRLYRRRRGSVSALQDMTGINLLGINPATQALDKCSCFDR